MNKLKINEELLWRLKGRFNESVNDLDLDTFEVYSKNNINTCPYVVVRNKIQNNPFSFYLVNEMKNMAIAGKKFGKESILNTVLYLDGREGYKL